VAAWQSGADPRPLEGESMVDVGQRVADLLSSLRKQHAGHGVVCVTHSDPIGALLGHLHGTPGPARYPPGVPVASITVIDVGPDGPKERLARYEPFAGSK
jgi:broad specificity phosphatase PhoE